MRQRKNIISCFLTSYTYLVAFFWLIFFNTCIFSVHLWDLQWTKSWSFFCGYCAYGLFLCFCSLWNIWNKRQEILVGSWTVWCRCQWVILKKSLRCYRALFNWLPNTVFYFKKSPSGRIHLSSCSSNQYFPLEDVSPGLPTVLHLLYSVLVHIHTPTWRKALWEQSVSPLKTM